MVKIVYKMKKKISLVLLFLVCLTTIISIASIVEKKQDLRTRAAQSTALSFSPSSNLNNPIQKQVGDTISLNVMLDPGKNYVSIVKVHITYDPSSFSAKGKSTFVVNKSA